MIAFQFIGKKLFAPLQVPEQNRKTRINLLCVDAIHSFSQYSVTGDGFYPLNPCQL